MKGLVLTYLIAFGGAALAVVNPFVGVCIFWLFDIVRPQYMFGWAGPTANLSDVVAIATIVGWCFKGFGARDLGRGRLIFAFYLAHSAWILVSAGLAPDHAVAFAFVTEQLKRTLMFTIAITTADSVRRVAQLAWVIAGSAGYVAFELNLRYLGGSNEAHWSGYGGLDNNALAISMVTCLGVAAFLGLQARLWWHKSAALVCALLISHTVLLTFSRGGMLAMTVAAAAGVAAIQKRARHVFFAVAATVVVISLAGPEVRARFNSSFEEERDSSAQSRVDLWLDCVTVMREYPLFGAGPDHFPLIAESFGWPRGKEAHSLWLQMGAEIGPVGAIFLLLFYLTIIRRLWPLARGNVTTTLGDWGRPMACMVITSLTGFVVSVQFVTLEGLESPLYIAAIAIGTLSLQSGVGHGQTTVSSVSRQANVQSIGRQHPTRPSQSAGVSRPTSRSLGEPDPASHVPPRKRRASR